MEPVGEPHASDPRIVKRLERPIASDWLALRRPADERAREASRPLLHALADHFFVSEEVPVVEVIDIGAGTGANQAWLAPRLDFHQRWTLLDHDPELLELVPDHQQDGPVQQVTRVVAGIEDLGALDQATGQHCLVTCSALLDLLSTAQLDGLSDFLVERGIPALLSLSVTGDVEPDPAHPFDAEINAAFNDHQSRDPLAGPAAVGYTAERLRNAGMRVQLMDTPWRLEAADGPLMRRYLQDRAQAVTEQNPALAAAADAWLADRLARESEGRLRLGIGHQDLLCLPPR
ncbi:class I SAM-dependent methyltransferase [Arthrobacter rhombi]|uniref:class I SAM-dependent methyltransferase n=1 Tax=Arthrobacter rhombi TaxID=71253 RepID=UPI003FD5A720